MSSKKLDLSLERRSCNEPLRNGYPLTDNRRPLIFEDQDVTRAFQVLRERLACIDSVPVPGHVRDLKVNEFEALVLDQQKNTLL